MEKHFFFVNINGRATMEDYNEFFFFIFIYEIQCLTILKYKHEFTQNDYVNTY